MGPWSCLAEEWFDIAVPMQVCRIISPLWCGWFPGSWMASDTLLLGALFCDDSS